MALIRDSKFGASSLGLTYVPFPITLTQQREKDWVTAQVHEPTGSMRPERTNYSIQHVGLTDYSAGTHRLAVGDMYTCVRYSDGEKRNLWSNLRL
jgi:hypothetical protein